MSSFNREEELTRALLKLHYMERRVKEFGNKFEDILGVHVFTELFDLVYEYRDFAFGEDYEEER